MTFRVGKPVQRVADDFTSTGGHKTRPPRASRAGLDLLLLRTRWLAHTGHVTVSELHVRLEGKAPRVEPAALIRGGSSPRRGLK